MPDSFGLCGVIAGHALGLLTNKSNWLDVDYDLLKLKNSFDIKMKTG